MNDAEEDRAAWRYLMMNLMRLAAIFGVIGGIAMARDIIPAPYWLGVALAVGSMVAFFFVPPLMARRWKKADRGE